ncbi:MAG: hypothetical protein ACLTDR_14915 [Adlercreutzia equolifaciens]
MNPQGNPKMMLRSWRTWVAVSLLRRDGRAPAARFVASQAKITVADAPAAPRRRACGAHDEAKAADEN